MESTFIPRSITTLAFAFKASSSQWLTQAFTNYYMSLAHAIFAPLRKKNLLSWKSAGTFFQNLHWKLGQLAPSFGSILAYLFRDYGLKNIFFRNKTFLFFQEVKKHLFEIEFRETSQNFNSFRQLLFSFYLLVIWLSWNCVRFREILF